MNKTWSEIVDTIFEEAKRRAGVVDANESQLNPLKRKR